jgi:Family of unknown function (DUF6659)
MESIPDIQDYKKKCELLLQIPDIRFAGLLDPMGNLVVGGFRPDVEPLKDENERKKMFMEVVLRQRTREEFDHNLGSVEYAAARRKNVIVLSFPIGKNVLLISAEKHLDIERTAKKIMDIWSFVL